MPDNKTKSQQDFATLHADMLRKEERAFDLRRQDRMARSAERWKSALPQLEQRLRTIKGFDLGRYNDSVQKIVVEDDATLREELIQEFGKQYDVAVAKVFPKLPKPEKTGTVIQAITAAGGECLQIADLASCPESVFAPPYTLAEDGGDDMHAADSGTGRISARVRRAGLSWPHAWAQVSNPVAVPGNSSQVVIKASVDVTRVGVTLAGAGFAHGWCSIELSVSDGHTMQCRDFRELINRSQWFSLFDTFFISDPGPHLELVCCFERAALDPDCMAHFVASVKVTVDGTYFGFSGGITEIFAVVNSFRAIGCP